jgi:hypothetical protein
LLKEPCGTKSSQNSECIVVLLDEDRLRLAVARPLTTDEESGLTRWKFAHPFRVRFAYFDELPRTAAGKFEDFISEVEPRR